MPDYWAGAAGRPERHRPIEQFDTSAFKVHFGGEVKDLDARDGRSTPRLARHLDRFAQFALVAAIEAVKDSGLDFAKEDPFRCGVILGTGIGGLNEFEEQHAHLHDPRARAGISPFVIPKMIANAAVGQHLDPLRPVGPNTAVATACASAAHAIGDAFHAIQCDHADVMITGGAEAGITPMGLGGFIACRALSHAQRRPASAPAGRSTRTATASSSARGPASWSSKSYEHAKKRGAKIYAEVLGCGNTADAYHITAPHPEGPGAARAMTNALRGRRLEPGRRRLHQRPRHQHRAGRRGRDAWPIKKVFGDARLQAGDLQHQEHGRPPARGVRRRRADRLCPDDQARRRPPDDQPTTRPTRPATSTTCPTQPRETAGPQVPSPTASASAGTTRRSPSGPFDCSHHKAPQ